jgi:DNA-binding IclR family transcriptional regulator
MSGESLGRQPSPSILVAQSKLSATEIVSASVLAKVRRIVLAFSDTDIGLTVTELAERTGIPKSSVHRLCQELVGAEFLERNQKVYGLGQMFGIGAQVRMYQTLRNKAEPFLLDLFAQTNVGVHFAVQQGLNVRTLSRIVGARTPHPVAKVFSKSPLHSSANGKAFMAFSPNRHELLEAVIRSGPRAVTGRTVVTSVGLSRQIKKFRQLGYAYETEETALGWKAVAIPVWNYNGEVVAAISISAPITQRDLLSYLPILKDTTIQISKALENSA